MVAKATATTTNDPAAEVRDLAAALAAAEAEAARGELLRAQLGEAEALLRLGEPVDGATVTRLREELAAAERAALALGPLEIRLTTAAEDWREAEVARIDAERAAAYAEAKALRARAKALLAEAAAASKAADEATGRGSALTARQATVGRRWSVQQIVQEVLTHAN